MLQSKADSSPLVAAPKVTLRQHLLIAQIVLAILVDSTYVNEVRSTCHTCPPHKRITLR